MNNKIVLFKYSRRGLIFFKTLWPKCQKENFNIKKERHKACGIIK